jgi:hypothetical protein
MGRRIYLVPKAITAYREFELGANIIDGVYHVILQPLGLGAQVLTAYTAGVNEAVCRSCRKIPGFQCMCGFYAYKTLGRFYAETISSRASHTYGTSMSGLLQHSVIGAEVELTGRVIEHEEGYRAQKLEIKEIVWSLPDEATLIDLGVPYVPEGTPKTEPEPEPVQEIGFTFDPQRYTITDADGNEFTLECIESLTPHLSSTAETLASLSHTLSNVIGYNPSTSTPNRNTHVPIDVVKKLLHKKYKVDVVSAEDFFERRKYDSGR